MQIHSDLICRFLLRIALAPGIGGDSSRNWREANGHILRCLVIYEDLMKAMMSHVCVVVFFV